MEEKQWLFGGLIWRSDVGSVSFLFLQNRWTISFGIVAKESDDASAKMGRKFQ